MNSHNLRALYTAFAGEAGYEKFVDQIFRDLQIGHELRHWQQRSWAAFRAVNTDVPTDEQSIRDAFSWCSIHQTHFTTLNEVNECPRETDDGFSEAFKREFPFCYGIRLCLNCLAARDQWVLNHPFVKPTIPVIDWAELENAVFRITKDELRLFATAHSKDTFYGFTFDCNSSYGNVLLCLNTEEALRDRAKSYKSQNSDRHRNETIEDLAAGLRWETGDWKYQGFESSKFESQWSPFSEAVQTNCLDEKEDPETFMTPTQTKFMNAMCRIAIRLEASDAFDFLNRTPNFTVFVTDHDESRETAWSRLDAIRRQGV